MGAVTVIRKFRRLFDVTWPAPAPNDGDVVTYDSGTDKLILAPVVVGPSNLEDLNDVTGGPPAVGEAPIWDGDSFELTDVATQGELSAAVSALVATTRLLTAGAGLAGGGDLSADRTFSVNVDGTTLEINADTLRVVAGVFAAAVHAHAGEDITSGTVAEARIASTIARDSEVSAAIAAALAAADGAGLSDNGSGVLAVNVDGTTIEINVDTLRVVAGVFAELPITVGDMDAEASTVGQLPTSDGAGNVTWQSPAGGAPSGSAGGALDGSYPNPGLAASVAGAGLAESSDVLSVNVDGTTIEINADALRVVAGVFAAASHAHAGEDITSGTVADARIASTIARDSEVAAAISAHEGAADPHPTYTTGAEVAAFAQPLDSDLTAIAALTTTSYGRALLALADEAALKAALNLEAGTDYPAQSTFDDHSARHENGGGDELSIAGLDGTSTALQAHLDDTTDAHDAGAVSVLDTGDNYTATDVEGVLAEIAGQLGGGSFWSDTIVKQSDESVTTSTTLQNDDELLFPILANTTYYFELLVVITSASSSADFKCDFALSAGSVINVWRQHVGLGPTTQVIQVGQVADLTTVIVFATGTSAANAPANKIIGMVRADTNANMVFRWAQNSSDAQAVTVKAGSVLRYRTLI